MTLRPVLLSAGAAHLLNPDLDGADYLALLKDWLRGWRAAHRAASLAGWGVAAVVVVALGIALVGFLAWPPLTWVGVVAVAGWAGALTASEVRAGRRWEPPRGTYTVLLAGAQAGALAGLRWGSSEHRALWAAAAAPAGQGPTPRTIEAGSARGALVAALEALAGVPEGGEWGAVPLEDEYVPAAGEGSAAN